MNKEKYSLFNLKEFADTYGMKFLETSAKTAHNVADSFITMTKEIITQMSEKEKNISNKNGIIINKIDEKKSTKIDLSQSKSTNLNKKG